MQPQTTTRKVIEQEKQIVREVAGLRTTDVVSFNDTGWDSRVYSINNGQYFFKFPRSEKIRGRFEQQIAALKLAAGINSAIKLPKVVWEHLDNNYFGYEGVLGAAFDDIAATLDAATKQTIGKAIGEFLKQFHKLKLPGARDVTIEKKIAQFQDWYVAGLPTIQTAFSEDEQQKLKKLVYELWPSELLDLGSETVLCHGDVNRWNILHTSDGQLGLIDFGDVGYYDHSQDFIGFDDDVVFESALRAYGDGQKLRQKIVARQKTLPMLELPYFMAKQNETAVQRTLAKIKATVY